MIDITGILNSIKLRPGTSNFTDELLKDLINDSITDIVEFIRLEEEEILPLGCIGIVKDLVIVKINRIGSEGISSESHEGVSQSFIDDIPKEIKARLRRYRRLPR